MSANNPTQQQRIAQKILRQFVQILRSVDGVIATLSQNAVQDYLVTVAQTGSWASTHFYALIKIQENPLSSFPVQGFPVNKLMVCIEGDNSTLGSVLGTSIDIGLFSEVLARLKDMGCELEVFVTALGTQPADQATLGGTFNSGSSSLLKRHVRASVDTLGMGQ